MKRAPEETPAVLCLEDGTVFTGVAFGAVGTVTGEVCFNTGMTGYQEILTDPSYHGQIVCMTAPQIGNTGVNPADDQSARPWVRGFIVRESSSLTSSWRAEGSLPDYLARAQVPGIAEIDTRRLTRHLRSRGALRGTLSSEGMTADEAIDRARTSPSLVGLDLAREVTTERAYRWDQDTLRDRSAAGFAAGAEASPATAELARVDAGSRRYRIAALDLGIKRNILDLLVASGFDVTVLPATATAAEVAATGCEGVFLSNGPGDPDAVTYTIGTVGTLLGRMPVFGICLGHQILALALGATTYKLPFGHRGSNHPVRSIHRKRIEITCQNHGFAVDAASLERTDARLTHVNLNDGTVEGLEVPGIAYSVQYHPEAGPGPHDSRYLFTGFRNLIDEFQPRSSRLEVTV